MPLFSSKSQLERIAMLVRRFSTIPFAPPDSVPGAVLMAVLAEVHDAHTLETYDFVDVIKAYDGVGWQVKSTKQATPVTWKRAKIPGKDTLIAESLKSSAGVQELGDAIVGFCNQHVAESFHSYGLDEIGYARLVVRSDGTARYFERRLATKANQRLFNPKEFTWKWSTQKKTKKKEQLSALHGTHVPSGRKWWAWHGLGENQLHFSGESAWWAQDLDHAIEFELPTLGDRLSMQDFIELLENAE